LGEYLDNLVGRYLMGSEACTDIICGKIFQESAMHESIYTRTETGKDEVTFAKLVKHAAGSRGGTAGR
jgi:hypothetical protein